MRRVYFQKRLSVHGGGGLPIPLPVLTSSCCHCSGQYGYYWNALLFN